VAVWRLPPGYHVMSLLIPVGLVAVLSIAALPAVVFGRLLIPQALGLGGVYSIAIIALFLPCAYCLFGFSLCAMTVLAVQIGGLDQQPPEIPLRGFHFAKFTLYHALNGLLLRTVLPTIANTWLIVLFYRAMGAHIGRDTYVNTPWLSECGMISIGSCSMLGAHVVINAHSAENGKVLFAPISIGNRVSIGAGTVILPGVVVEDDVTVAANSLVPKYKVLKSGRTYAGVPVRIVTNGTERIAAGEPIVDVTPAQAISILVEGYKLRSSEASDMAKFMVKLLVTAIGVIFSGVFYSVINSKMELLAGIPPLVAFTLAMFANLSTSMLKNANKMCEIELRLKAQNVRGLDWELRFGGIGRARAFDPDAVFINLVLVGLLVVGLWLTWNGYLVDPAAIFAGIQTLDMILIVDGIMIAWMAFSVAYFLVLRRRFEYALDNYSVSLGFGERRE
jgi:hypothetical protein